MPAKPSQRHRKTPQNAATSPKSRLLRSFSTPQHSFVPLLILFGVLLAACSGGARTTLVEAPPEIPPTPTPPVVIDLPPAPEEALPQPPASPDLPLESSVDDALLSWADERDFPYIDNCALIPIRGVGEFCDLPGDRDTVRLLGTSEDDIWYIVIVDQVETDVGSGFRVGEVRIAGR